MPRTGSSPWKALARFPLRIRKKFEFAYDADGRRVRSKAYSWNTGTSQYDLSSERKFIYDGWLCLAETNASLGLLRSYCWGRDLSGSFEGAGGVGGLLWMKDAATATLYNVSYDGNGNVVKLTKASDGTVAASYEYSPFGEVIESSGAYAASNPFRFSTKYHDASGLLYYGYRYLNPDTGRWISRDPVREHGGLNLYAFIANNSVNDIDYLGMVSVTDIPAIMRANGWLNGVQLMDHWFSGSGAANKTTIQMDSWVLTFARAKTVYDQLIGHKVYVNAAKKEIVKLATTKDKDYIQYRTVGSLSDPVDDMFAALGRFNLRVIVEGSVTVAGNSHCFEIKQVGIYVQDSYDFVGTQRLGYWNATTNYGGKNPFRGDLVTNADFRAHGGGRDFIVFSDIKVTTLDPFETFHDP